ncbi:hypothetical protein D3C81_1516590 [compost metagenome]
MTKRFPGGDEYFRQRTRMYVVQPIGNVHGHAIVDACQFRVTTAAHDSHDAVANGETLRLGAHRNHLAGDLQAHEVRIAEVRAPVAATPVREVRAVETGGTVAHQQVMGADLRVRHVGEFQNVGIAKFSESDGFHCQSLMDRTRAGRQVSGHWQRV